MKDIFRIAFALTVVVVGHVKWMTARTHGSRFRAASWTEAKLARLAR